MSVANFKDHFSKHAPDYARFRPNYPESLYRYLSSLAPGNALAWDCACGSGQAALGLTPYFQKVMATDASEAQIAHAGAHEKIQYEVATAEHTDLSANSVDLCVVAQAAHWFDLPEFFREAKRVLKVNGIVALWSYGLTRITPPVDALVDELYEDIVGEYWPPERQMIEDGYANLKLPFTEINPPRFDMSVRWDLSQLLGYLRTWSAVKRYQQARGKDPVAIIETAMAELWGSGDAKKTIHWPLNVRVARNDLIA
ncbi:class I SAM-dependent methyltransferase [Kaarinaea lacus]